MPASRHAFAPPALSYPSKAARPFAWRARRRMSDSTGWLGAVWPCEHSAMSRAAPSCIKASRRLCRPGLRAPRRDNKAPPGSTTWPPSSNPWPRTPAGLRRSRGHSVASSTPCGGGLLSRRACRRLAVTSTRSAGAMGRACLGPTTSAKVAAVIHGAACCGPRASRAKRSGHCNAKAPGSADLGHRQRPRCWGPCVQSHRRTWRRNGSALLRIASASACRVDP